MSDRPDLSMIAAVLAAGGGATYDAKALVGRYYEVFDELKTQDEARRKARAPLAVDPASAYPGARKPPRSGGGGAGGGGQSWMG